MATTSKRSWVYKGETKTAWVVRYTDTDGRKRTRTAASKREADRLRLQIETEIELGSHLAISMTITVERLAEEYLRDLEQRLRDKRIGFSHAKRQVNIIRRYLIPALGKLKVANLKLQNVMDLYENIRANGVSAPTAKGYIRYFGYMEKFAEKRQYTKRLVFNGALRELSGIKTAKITTFTLEDVRALLRALEEPGYRNTRRLHAMMRCAVNLAAFCGLRWGEIFGLKTSNVDLENNVLHIRQTMTLIGLNDTTKTPAGRRDIPLPAHIRELLTVWMRTCFCANKDDLVFTVVRDAPAIARRTGQAYERGRRVQHACFYPAWRALLARAGLTDRDAKTAYHFHALRHFASALMVENHIPLTDVATLMGHRHFDMTLQVYAHSIVGGHTRHAAFEQMSSMVEMTNDQQQNKKSLHLSDLRK